MERYLSNFSEGWSMVKEMYAFLFQDPRGIAVMLSSIGIALVLIICMIMIITILIRKIRS